MQYGSFDDENNEMISIAPAYFGTNILEKHYTLDEGVERIDFHRRAARRR